MQEASWVISEKESEGRRIVAARRRVTFGESDLGEIIGDVYGVLFPTLQQGEGEIGRMVIAYEPVGDRTADMLVGVEWAGEAPQGYERVDLPAARVAHTTHVGPYEGLPAAHQAIHAWLRQQGQSEVGLNWEVYGDHHDDPAQLRTEVFYLRLT